MTTFFTSLASAIVGLGEEPRHIQLLLPATAMFVVIMPDAALQSVRTSVAVLAGWAVGAAVGACFGVSGGARIRARSLRA